MQREMKKKKKEKANGSEDKIREVIELMDKLSEMYQTGVLKQAHRV